ncbi:MAG: thioredoxin [Candidatus Cloacimonetes bacterium]|nr:thioredoxin [Candidatus Cloacimonadota bacterium]
MIIELTDKNYEEKISKGAVLIDFWAPWCGPCNILAPVIEEVAKEITNVIFAKINVDDFPELAGKHGVMSIPTLKFYKDGAEVDSSIGVVSKNVILKKLEQLLA